MVLKFEFGARRTAFATHRLHHPYLFPLPTLETLPPPALPPNSNIPGSETSLPISFLHTGYKYSLSVSFLSDVIMHNLDEFTAQNKAAVTALPESSVKVKPPRGNAGMEKGLGLVK